MNFTLKQIETDPANCWDQMSSIELQRFEERYYARIAKEAIRKLKIEMLEEKRKASLEERGHKFLKKVLAIFCRISHLHHYNLDEDLIHYHGRSIGNDIHDLPTIWTGYESQDSVKKREEKGYRPSNEHFYPRQYAGEQIVRHIIDNKGIEIGVLLEMLNNYRQVHRVTPEENRNLMKYQASNTFIDPETAYEQAGITLVKVNK